MESPIYDKTDIIPFEKMESFSGNRWVHDKVQVIQENGDSAGYYMAAEFEME